MTHVAQVPGTADVHSDSPVQAEYGFLRPCLGLAVYHWHHICSQRISPLVLLSCSWGIWPPWFDLLWQRCLHMFVTPPPHALMERLCLPEGGLQPRQDDHLPGPRPGTWWHPRHCFHWSLWPTGYHHHPGPPHHWPVSKLSSMASPSRSPFEVAGAITHLQHRRCQLRLGQILENILRDIVRSHHLRTYRRSWHAWAQTLHSDISTSKGWASWFSVRRSSCPEAVNKSLTSCCKSIRMFSSLDANLGLFPPSSVLHGLSSPTSETNPSSSASSCISAIDSKGGSLSTTGTVKAVSTMVGLGCGDLGCGHPSRSTMSSPSSYHGDTGCVSSDNISSNDVQSISESNDRPLGGWTPPQRHTPWSNCPHHLWEALFHWISTPFPSFPQENSAYALVFDLYLLYCPMI